MSDIVHDQTETNGNTEGPVVLINIFTPKNADLDAFVTAQLAEYERQRGVASGWIGNTLCRAVDGTTAVNVAVFRSLADYRTWRDSKDFAEHLEIIQPFVESSRPGMYFPVYGSSAKDPGEGILTLG
jgi:heme-degrading monooxygenase HmoA